MNAQLAETLASVFGMKVSEIVPGLTQSDIESWDSLKQMDLVVSLEDRFNVTLDVEDIVRMTSVSEIEAVLLERGVVFEP